MADRVGDSGQRAGTPGADRRASRTRLFRSARVRSVLAIVPRLVLLCVIVWAFTGPIDRVPTIVGAAGMAPGAPPTDSTVLASPLSQAGGFAVADGPISSYFTARGGVRTFGPPVSNAFPLLGSTVQIFRDHVLKVEPNGTVSTVNLFALGAIPFRNVGGRIIPEVDQALVASAPVPGSPDYAARVQEFVKANAPDQWENLPVGFYQAFAGTVKYEDAFPNGGERALLSGFSQEIWGLPVSRPMRDAQDPNVVLLRWERGVMVWSRQTGSVATIPLGEAFKQVLTGEGLGPERTAAAAGSQFLMQAKAGAPNGIARPAELPNTVLASAFAAGNPAINAAQISSGYTTPTPTWTPVVNMNPPPPPLATLTPTLPGGVAGVPTVPGALPGAAVPPPAPGVAPAGGVPQGAAPAPGLPPSANPDVCVRDEQITFSPETLRVNNEVLIVVTSSRSHPYGRLSGTEKTNFVRERPGQLGWVGEWTVALSYPGRHEYTFYVDSTVPCKKLEFTVLQSLSTRTPTPTKTATPWGWDNGNSNNSNSNNSNGNSNDNTSFYVTTAPPWSPFTYIGQGDAFNCETFQSQAQAQAVLRADPTDPNNLDTDFDGIACEDYGAYPYPNEDDTSQVTRIVGAPTNTPMPVSTPTRAQRVPGEACSGFTGESAQQFLLNNPTDPLRMDESRDGIACGGVDGAGFMNPPLRSSPPLPPPRNYQ
ncbi:MAG TPA: hypothetical protein VFH48_06415 [Chloroflexota bacterium]|nr:hypothetical protein [Chloroflexota bacterium]